MLAYSAESDGYATCKWQLKLRNFVGWRRIRESVLVCSPEETGHEGFLSGTKSFRGFFVFKSVDAHLDSEVTTVRRNGP
jgi:hypothetical protein